MPTTKKPAPPSTEGFDATAGLTPPAAAVPTVELIAAAEPAPVKPPGPRGATTTEFVLAVLVAALVLAAAVAVLIWSPDPAQRKTVSDTLTKLVELAGAYIVSRGLAKFGQGVANVPPDHQ